MPRLLRHPQPEPHRFHYLHQRDGYLEPTHEVMRGVVKLIREVRPDVVLSMHPERNWKRIQKSHPDHLAVGRP